MKKLTFVLLGTILFLANIAISQTAKTTTGTLTFNVSGFEDNTGQVVVQLFHKYDDMPSSPFKKVTATIVNKAATVEITDLLYGDYAAIILHDQNSDGEVEHCLGIPCEPLGFTNNWDLTLFSGMPTFDKLKFNFSKTNNTFTVKVE